MGIEGIEQLKPPGSQVRRKKFNDQIVVRITPELRKALEKDALENGRTVAQSARHHLWQSLGRIK